MDDTHIEKGPESLQHAARTLRLHEAHSSRTTYALPVERRSFPPQRLTFKCLTAPTARPRTCSRGFPDPTPHSVKRETRHQLPKAKTFLDAPSPLADRDNPTTSASSPDAPSEIWSGYRRRQVDPVSVITGFDVVMVTLRDGELPHERRSALLLEREGALHSGVFKAMPFGCGLRPQP